MRVLKDVRYVMRWTSFIGALEGVLKELGERRFSPADIYVFSGYAFRLNIHETLCASGPTAFDWAEMVAQVCDRLGYDYHTYECAGDSNLFELRRKEAHEAIKKSINKKCPVIAWDILIPEFGVIKGYDDKKKVYLVSSPMDIKKEFEMPYKDLGAGDVRHLYVLALGQKVKINWWESVLKSLEFAIYHARSLDFHMGGYSIGLAGYDTWIKALRKKDTDFFGNTYNIYVWSECRRFAAEFLTLISQRKNVDGANKLKKCARYYQDVDNNLAELKRVFTWPPKEDELLDAKIRRKAIKHLKAAAAAEALGVEELEKFMKPYL